MTLNSLLKNPFKKKPVARLPATLPHQHRLYCVGDIHGRLDLLSALHQIIAEDAANAKGHITIVYLGDYVDRGMDSKATIDCLINDHFPDFKKVFLQGNHEQLLLQFLLNNDPGFARNWLQFGGLTTLMSYGVELHGIPTAHDINRIRKEFEEKLPETHLAFFQNLRLSYEAGDYFFVHAGIKPKVKLHNQQPEDLLWIRNEFLNSELFHEKIIVHGHSVSAKPEYLPNRIGIDTGAYYSGKLSCAVFEAESCKFL